MAEVVSFSEPSPLEADRTGLGWVAFSASDGCSGTGITPATTANQGKSCHNNNFYKNNNNRLGGIPPDANINNNSNHKHNNHITTTTTETTQP